MLMFLKPSQLMGQVIEGKFRLKRFLGRGAFGTVFQADEELFGRPVSQVAVKLLVPEDDAQREAIIHEIQELAQLTHDHILLYRTSGVLEENQACYLVTELAEGSLKEACQRPERLGLEETRAVAEGMASALAYIHSQGKVHRDVKPGNILRVGDRWKLADFGLVRAVEASLVAASGQKGTLAYMSPEALNREVGPATDVYALGVTLLECLTGHRAHEGRSEREFLMNLMTRPANIPADLPEPWKTLLPRCLEKDPRRRCRASEILDLLGSGPALAPPLPRSPGGLPSSPSPEKPSPSKGAEMVLVPAGEFLRGTSDEQAERLVREGGVQPDWLNDEQPQRRITLEAFYIDVHPVTNAQYKEFLSWMQRTQDHSPCHPDEPERKDHTPRYWNEFQWNRPEQPVVGIDWWDAYAYASWAGKRLPTEAEWEKAARGTDGRLWPWGDEWDRTKCNCRDGGPLFTTPVGSYPQGASPYGCQDMAGNVWEWCLDWYDEDYYSTAPDSNPTGPPSGTRRVLRGGSWYYNPNFTRTAHRHRRDPDLRIDNVGLRCARTPPERGGFETRPYQPGVPYPPPAPAS